MNASFTSLFCMAALFLGSTMAQTTAVTTCPSRDQRCMNVSNFAHCKRLEKTGCKIRATKSCPIRFSCAKGVVPKPTVVVPTPVARPKPVPTVGSKPVPSVPTTTPKLCPSMSTFDTTKFAQCMDWIVRGCTDIKGRMIDFTQIWYPPGTPRPPEPEEDYYTCGHAMPARPPVCPTLQAPLMNPTNRAQCQSLVQKGCKKILAREAFPIIEFYCGHGLGVSYRDDEWW